MLWEAMTEWSFGNSVVLPTATAPSTGMWILLNISKISLQDSSKSVRFIPMPAYKSCRFSCAIFSKSSIFSFSNLAIFTFWSKNNCKLMIWGGSIRNGCTFRGGGHRMKNLKDLNCNNGAGKTKMYTVSGRYRRTIFIHKCNSNDTYLQFQII